MTNPAAEVFDQWARDGKDAGMEEGHSDVVAQVMETMDIRPGDQILDLGCGTGLWGLIAAHIVESDCWLTLTDVHAPSGECSKQKAQVREYGDVLT